MSIKLTSKEITKAVARYARKHGFYANTIRSITSLRRQAVVEWLVANNDQRLSAYVEVAK